MNKFLLSVSLLLSLSLGCSSFDNSVTLEEGWTSSELLQNGTLFSEVPISWVGSGIGKTRLLYLDYESTYGSAYQPRDQGSAPSCVGQATAAACDILAATQIHEGKLQRAPPGEACAATIYGWSRIDIAGINTNDFGGGSRCRWAVEAIQKFGVVPLRNFEDLQLDLSKPSAQRCIKYGYSGVPTQLVTIGQQHIIVEFIQLNSYEDVRDAVFNGSPVIVGSGVGFGTKNGAKRDKDGFLKRPRRSNWNHAMAIIGVSDEGRKGALLLNSWGPNWISGPTRFGSEPQGSFWADADAIDEIVDQGDSYAIRMFVGYPKYQIWKE